PVSVPRPARELLSSDEYRRVAVDFRAVKNLIAAAVSAKIALRLGAFEKAVRKFAERKRRAGGGTESVDFDRVRQLVEQFFRLRIFFFCSKSECLFDSLSLLNFLARYGIHADWVFG